MSETFRNSYEDTTRAAAYAELEFPGTYGLAFRDLPAIVARHARGGNAVDFGCGTGRSTRFLRQLGFDVVGVDVSEAMLARAREVDPDGRYHLIGADGIEALALSGIDLVLSAFTFDNIPSDEAKLRALTGMRAILGDDGCIVNLVSTPEIYTHEWASFSTSDFPENRTARHGDPDRIVMLDVPDRRPVEDVLCTDAGYRSLYRAAGLEVVEVARPLGTADDGIAWVSERHVAPWAIYVLRKARER